MSKLSFKSVLLYRNQNTHFAIFIQDDISKYTLYTYYYIANCLKRFFCLFVCSFVLCGFVLFCFVLFELSVLQYSTPLFLKHCGIGHLKN